MASDEGLADSLLERLVSDAAFRAEFRRDPVAAAREAGLDGLADELLAAGSDPLQTLDLRESRSSLAGVVMAAAIEGIGLSSGPELHGSASARAPALTPEDLAARRAERSDRGVWAAQVAAPREDHPEASAAEPSARAAVTPEPRHERIDPAEYGMGGTGGKPSAEALALLHDRHVTLDADGIADLKAGRIDPRVVSVLTELSRRHTITISAMCSDHPKLSAGGSISNHYYGRAFDIATLDGQPVGPGNAAAKRVAISLARLSPDIRPTEIGSPWALSGPAYFTDAAHQNHLHIGFDDPIERDWRPPDDVAVEAPASARSGAASDPVEVDDDSESDDGGDSESNDDGDAREDGGSGDTEESEADDESDGDEDDADDDEDEDEPDEDEPDEDGDGGGDEDDDEEDDDAEEDDEKDDDEEDDDEEDDDESDDRGDESDDGGDDDESDDGESPGSSGDGWREPDTAPGPYPGDEARKEDFAAWMAGQARRRGIPPELPIMASLVESGLSNLDYGDADSVGFFQMRVGIWNQGAYAGYPDRPELQLKWFLDQAVAVKKQRLARGLPVDPKHYGDWIADVERPAAQYRGRYQPRLAEARELLERAAGLGRHRSEQSAESGNVLRLRVIDPEEARRAARDGG